MAQIFTLDSLSMLLESSDQAYLEFLRSESLSAGLYSLPAQGKDLQSPHQQDEVYLVLSGRAIFELETDLYPVVAGSLIYVPAGEPHRFTEIEEELNLLVLFAPPET